MSKDHKRLKIEKTTPGYWKVTLNNPPIFSSAAAHEFHLQQDYTKRMFASLDGKTSEAPTLTALSAL
jgi:hypothetical protein